MSFMPTSIAKIPCEMGLPFDISQHDGVLFLSDEDEGAVISESLERIIECLDSVSFSELVYRHSEGWSRIKLNAQGNLSELQYLGAGTMAAVLLEIARRTGNYKVSAYVH